MDIKYAFYSTSKGYRVLGGTAAQFLKADGSLDSNNYSLSGHTHAFSQITAKPTTASGYGITDVPRQAVLGGDVNSVRSADTRNTNPLPSTDIRAGVWFDFKSNSAIELNNFPVGTYGASMTFVPYSDNSGNNNTAFRLVQSSNNLFFQNYNNTWGAWNKIFHTGNFNPDLYLSLTGGTLTGALTIRPASGGSLFEQDVITFHDSGQADGNIIPLAFKYGTSTSPTAFIKAVSKGSNGINGAIFQFFDNTTKHTEVSSAGVTSNTFIKSGGTSSQFLKADGSVDNNTYLSQSSLNTQLGNYAALNGIQTFTNTNTFLQSPVIPNGTLGNHAVNLNQLNTKVTNEDSVRGVAFDSGLPTGVPYFIHTNGTYVPIATQSWVSSNYISTSHIANTITLTSIQHWNYMAQYGLQLNSDFAVNTGSGLLIADDYFGGESGMVDRNNDRFVSAKQESFYKYGSRYGNFDGLNFNLDTRLFGMGRESNKEDKLTVEGSVKASKNFKSEEERPDTIFIPNGNVASLGDEIVNDESEYAIRLDPHEYEIGPSGYLDVDDRNRLIHIVGEHIKMVVNFKEIYPKQQIVIYNFDKYGGIMAVKVYGKDIYHIPGGSFLRLYVTKSRRVIAERDLPCEFVW
ncbi:MULTISPECIES: hypothetical protein [Chryseobacterium]|uniref:Uncharacterized protein n=1 Tax=Chryseobacterium taihuense TaxID=1141221 RepID=A0A4U8WAY0_9FLAO|nr:MULTISPECIES: hypothetical protein [Chryseobacterium]QQV03429.1 hypothetical protein I6I61_03520 [Chryseobacterium sp. FDAARGOS 1104]VFB03253.1 Uncharacterised protein [Chryseobacterium taihuense]